MLKKFLIILSFMLQVSQAPLSEKQIENKIFQWIFHHWTMGKMGQDFVAQVKGTDGADHIEGCSDCRFLFHNLNEELSLQLKKAQENFIKKFDTRQMYVNRSHDFQPNPQISQFADFEKLIEKYPLTKSFLSYHLQVCYLNWIHQSALSIKEGEIDWGVVFYISKGMLSSLSEENEILLLKTNLPQILFYQITGVTWFDVLPCSEFQGFKQDFPTQLIAQKSQLIKNRESLISKLNNQLKIPDQSITEAEQLSLKLYNILRNPNQNQNIYDVGLLDGALAIYTSIKSMVFDIEEMGDKEVIASADETYQLIKKTVYKIEAINDLCNINTKKIETGRNILFHFYGENLPFPYFFVSFFNKLNFYNTPSIKQSKIEQYKSKDQRMNEFYENEITMILEELFGWGINCTSNYQLFKSNKETESYRIFLATIRDCHSNLLKEDTMSMIGYILYTISNPQSNNPQPYSTVSLMAQMSTEKRHVHRQAQKINIYKLYGDIFQDNCTLLEFNKKLEKTSQAIFFQIPDEYIEPSVKQGVLTHIIPDKQMQ
jgi:hypothetical protein